MSLKTSFPLDVLLSLLLRCSCSDLLRLQQCSRQWREFLYSEKCVDYLLRQHCRLNTSQLSLVGQSAQPSAFLYRLLPCLASVEVHSLAHRSVPPLHRALLADALLHSPLSVDELSLLHEQPTSLLPWIQLPNSPLLRLQLQEIVQLAEQASNLSLRSIHLPDFCLWLLPQAACWAQRWDDYWLAVMHTAGWDSSGQGDDESEAKSEYEERSEWMSNALERMADKVHIGRLLQPRILWIGHIQQSPVHPPAVFGYYLGHRHHRRHLVPATLHHNPYTIHAAYSDTAEEECAMRLSDVHLDVSRLPVVVADLTASVDGLNGHWLHVYDSLAALLLSQPVGSRKNIEEVRHFVEQVHRTAGGTSEDAMHGAADSTAVSPVRPLYLTCFPGADRPRWID